MDRINLQSKDLLKENFEKIAELFPNVITEKDGEKKIDFEALKQELSDTVIEGSEKYQLTWPGKKSSILLANTPTNYSLKPVPEESVDFENTQNLYIEGDNLEVLKILQESYTGKIKCIYIDPPYNTGNDFVYKDDFKQSREEYALETGEISEENERLVSNPETSGRYHSDWLSMMYPRLKLARNLLSEDGVIFISIDDNEVHNLRKICEEIFGEDNFVTSFAQKARSGISNDKIVSDNHNYILFFAKNYQTINIKRNLFGIKRTEDDFKNYKKNDNDGKGFYALNPVTGPGGARKGNPYYEILGISNYWRYGEDTMKKLVTEGKVIKVNSNLYQKTYKNDLIFSKKGASTWLDNAGTTQEGTTELKNLFDNSIFDFPKPTKLIKFLLNFIDYDNNNIFLDFFSGSATTAHAVMQLNAENGEYRKYIMVQIPEKTPENSDANKAGYKNICEIGKERIRRAAKKIKEETNANIDYGFRVYKLSEPIYENTKISPKEQTQNNLFEENIRDYISNSEILTSVILDLGLELGLKTQEKMVDGKKVFLVEENYLFACFDKNIDLSNDSEIMKEIIKLKPQRIALLDSSFKDNQDKINFDNLIKQNLPECKGVKIV